MIPWLKLIKTNFEEVHFVLTSRETQEYGWSVGFPKENSLGTVLGFESKTYESREEPWKSEKIVNILSVNSILIHCDMISGSMVDGVKSPRTLSLEVRLLEIL